MAITGSIAELLKQRQEEQQKMQLPPVAEQEAPQSWMSELVNRRFSEKQDPRKKRTPIGFDFTREPFDPSSYYRSLETFKNVSRAATAVTQTEVRNREEAEFARQQAADKAAMQSALEGIQSRFTYQANTGGGLHNYKGLGTVTSNVASAASYFGSRWGIKSIGGYRKHGSVPNSDHPKGRALDFMTKNKSQGTSLAYDAIANAKKWGVSYVIWYRNIWTPSKGWRPYSGPSPHTDHVHVSFKY